MGGDEDPVLRHSFGHEVTFDVLAVDDDRIGVPVDVADGGKEQPVEGRLQPHPHAGPQDEGRALEPGHHIRGRQREATGDALDDDAVLPSPQAKGQGGG